MAIARDVVVAIATDGGDTSLEVSNYADSEKQVQPFCNMVWDTQSLQAFAGQLVVRCTAFSARCRLQVDLEV